MSKIQYSPVKALDASQVQKLVDSGKFDWLDSPEPGVNLQREQEIQLYSKKSGRLAFLRLETLRVDQQKDSRYLFFISMNACDSKSCSKQSINTAAQTESLANWRLLPTGVEIASIYIGDGNKDGINDVLVRMSNGAGFVLYSKQPQPSPQAPRAPVQPNRVSSAPRPPSDPAW